MSGRVPFHDTWEAVPGMDQTSYQVVGPGLVAMLRDLADDAGPGPWIPDHLLDEFWLHNQAGDEMQIKAQTAALLLHALPLLLSVVEAADADHEHATPSAKLDCPICAALNALDAPA